MRPGGALIVVSPRRSKITEFHANSMREKREIAEPDRFLPPLQPISPRKLSGLQMLNSAFKFPTIRPRLASDSGLLSPRVRETHKNLFRLHFAASQVGAVLNKPKPHNQDAYFYTDINPQCVFFGVCDGHGQSGHHVSLFLTNKLPEAVSRLSRNEGDLEQALGNAYENVNDALRVQRFDTVSSGSTCVSVLLTAEAIYCANVGDSRAVLCRKSPYSVQALPLSTDHKPELPSERQRILLKGGRIAPVYTDNNEPYGPARIWLPDDDSPGLAMTRAMGDFIATSIGLTGSPGNCRIRGDSTEKVSGRHVHYRGFGWDLGVCVESGSGGNH